MKSHPALPARLHALAVLIFLSVASTGFGQLANVWHLPSDPQSGIPSTMRDPVSPGAGQAVAFYQGVYKGDGANQTGGSLHYRVAGGAWQTVALSFYSNSGSNQFWSASVTLPSSPLSQFEYFFAPTFDNRTSPTYIHGTNQKTSSLATAQASPTSFTIGVAPLSMTVASDPPEP